MPQITCISFFKYETLANKIWAFGMMQYAHAYLANVDGLQFYKLMGSGKGLGFNPLPDWSVYTLLTIWKSQEHADQFINNSILYNKYQKHTAEALNIFMYNIQSHGKWSGQNPFEKIDEIDITNRKICAITRATIKKRFLPKFWKYVPTSHKPLHDNTSLIFTKGIGEIPIIQMATFSIWDSLDALKSFAYKSKEHNKAIKMTRELGWYHEELFARFVIHKTTGSWQGIAPNQLNS